MVRIEFSAESDVPPERVLAAACDFSERRPDLWPVGYFSSSSHFIATPYFGGSFYARSQG